MTFAELNSYKDKVEQLEIIREELKAEYLKGIDPSQVSVQTGTVGDPTALLLCALWNLKDNFPPNSTGLLLKLKRSSATYSVFRTKLLKP